jgi:pSer/pThr/pTyr-binding forkhead associated (FHA) protein
MTVIGRREDCDLRIPLGEISRKHCRLVRDEETLRLEDLGSSNGTYHNGQRIQESVLAAGDTVQIGPVVFVLQLDGVPADEDLQPVASPGLETTETDMQANVTEGEAQQEAVEYVAEGQTEDAEYAGGEVLAAEHEGGEYAAEGQTEEAEASEAEYLTSEELITEEAAQGGAEVGEGVAEGEELFLGEDQLVADPNAEAHVEEHQPPDRDSISEHGAEHQGEAEDYPTLESADLETEELTLDNLDIDADAHHPHG